METNVNRHGFSVIMSQLQEDNKLHPVAYASQSVSVAEVNYIITNLETLTVVWAITHFKYYVYGQNMTVVTDHAGVKAVLGVPNLTGKQARWWSKVYGSCIRQRDIVHTTGKENQHADALSRQPVLLKPPDDGVSKEVQIALISSDESTEISILLCEDLNDVVNHCGNFRNELRDPTNNG